MILRRIIALLILALIVGIILFALGVFKPADIIPPGLATDLALPPSVYSADVSTQIPAIITAIQQPASEQGAPSVVLQGTPYVSPTPQPTFTPTPLPVRNGRIIYLGVDKQIYSVDPVNGTPVKLGQSADFHLLSGPAWHSPDGQYILVVRQQDAANGLYVVNVTNPDPPIWVGAWQNGDQDPPRQRYEFSPDSARLLFVERKDSTLTLNVIDLPGGRRVSMPLTGGPATLNQAAFFGNGSRILVSQDDPDGGNPHLAVYQVGADGFTPISTLIAFPGFNLDQFIVSPGAKWVALALTDGTNVSSLFLVDTSQPQAVPILQDNTSRVLLLHPSWSPDGRFLLINRWQTVPQLSFGLLAYDTQAQSMKALTDGVVTTQEGSPVAVAASFAPDGQAVGFSLYDEEQDSVAFWLAVMDGSYSRVIATSNNQGDFPQGDFVVGIVPDWTRSVILASEPGSPLGSLYAAALDGTQRQLLDNLVPYRFLNLGPVLSPDGLSVAYMRLSLENGVESADLSVIGLDGSGKQSLFSSANPSGAVPGIPLVWLPALP